MADYRQIVDLEVEQGRVATSQTAFAFRDNHLAIAEGRAGAPPVSPWAFARAPVTVGDTARFKNILTYSTTNTSFTVMQVASVMNNGAVRIKCAHARIDGTGSSLAKITRVRAGTETELVAQTSATPISYDFTDLQPGDTILWWLRCQDSGATCTMSGIELCTGGELLHPIAPWFIYGTEPA